MIHYRATGSTCCLHCSVYVGLFLKCLWAKSLLGSSVVALRMQKKKQKHPNELAWVCVCVECLCLADGMLWAHMDSLVDHKYEIIYNGKKPQTLTHSALSALKCSALFSRRVYWIPCKMNDSAFSNDEIQSHNPLHVRFTQWWIRGCRGGVVKKQQLSPIPLFVVESLVQDVFWSYEVM